VHYTYRVDILEGDTWRTDIVAEDQTVDGRSSTDIARAIVEGWIVDHPEQLSGGGRVTVLDGAPDDPDLERHARVKVRIYEPAPDGPDFDELVLEGAGPPHPPAATAFILANPDTNDPNAWVNP